MRTIRIHQFGDPEVLQLETVDTPTPDDGQVLLRQTASGLNFIDIYMRTGVYPVDQFPVTLGMEGVGMVEAVGNGVTDLAPGDRVAYAMDRGSYADMRVIGADKLVKVPDEIDDETATAMMLKGFTAYYLLHRTYAVKPGDSILVYAAAGGVGSLLCQWARHIGATVIGCVGSVEKAELAKSYGCHHTVLYKETGIPTAVKELTGGKGVNVVYDSVGKATFEASLDALAPFGMMVSYGNASGKVEPFSPSILAPKGSLYVTRPTLATHVGTRELLLDAADNLFNAVSRGIVKIEINQQWPLEQIREAHQALESGTTTGCSILTL